MKIRIPAAIGQKPVLIAIPIQIAKSPHRKIATAGRVPLNIRRPKRSTMINRHHPRTRPRVIAQLLGVDNVGTREYHGRIGDVIHIEPYAIFKVDKVLVAIRAEKAGLIEHGLATLDPKTNQWHYIATADNPEKDDWSIAVTAVQHQPLKATQTRN